ncbi:MAG: type II/IV secretion system ATPase subunit [Candidatus Woesearchaeota archaeon]
MPDRGATFEVLREGDDTILHVDYTDVPAVPSIEDDDLCMAKTMDRLIENPAVTRIVFSQKRDYEYDYPQVRLLQEIAHIANQLAKNKDSLGIRVLGSSDDRSAVARYAELHTNVLSMLKKDPLGAYVELKRLKRRETILLEKTQPGQAKGIKQYLDILAKLESDMEKTRLILLSKPYLAGHHAGDRDIYRKIFSPSIKPDFMFTKVMASYPKGAQEVASYRVGETEVVIFKLQDSIQYLYHITPPEFTLTEEKYEILDEARKILSEHKPSREEFVNPDRMREVFSSVGQDLLEELAQYRHVNLTEEELDSLTRILVRYTVGFGLIEVLLEDPNVQDITVNSPMGSMRIFIVHGQFDECVTNIIPTNQDGESWASKLRLISGRPLDEANPVLDTEIRIPNVANARVGVISEPLNPHGIAYAFRRHRDKPWTLALFIKNKMISPLAAGLLSFLIDGNRTLLVAGTRSAGKSSLLGALMVEIMRKYRIITIEDTLELPVMALRALDYNIQPMKVASALAHGSSEVPADEGIRTTLRLGDSALIVGEVRSKEARALYEAMRVGALANVVAGTIHGDSAYGVFDRVVNDLEVPRTSFKATDIIVVANPIKSADGLHRWRRVTSIVEVRKEWQDDPSRERGFVELMKYDAKTDELLPTSDLLNGDSEILKAIAGSVKEWAGNWDAVWDSIQLRSDMKRILVEEAGRTHDDEILEAPFVVSANDEFHRISDRVKDEKGSLDSKQILFEWQDWLRRELQKRRESR